MIDPTRTPQPMFTTNEHENIFALPQTRTTTYIYSAAFIHIHQAHNAMLVRARAHFCGRRYAYAVGAHAHTRMNVRMYTVRGQFSGPFSELKMSKFEVSISPDATYSL